MIQINLLPPEYRKEEKAPIGLFLLIIFGVIFVSTIFFAYLFLERRIDKDKGKLNDIKNELQVKQDELDKLKANKEKIRKALVRQNTIVNISTSKVYWAEKLLQLSRIISKHNTIWITSIQMSETGAGQNSGGYLRINCFSKGLLETNVSKFRKDLIKDRTFYSIFDEIDSYKDLRPVILQVKNLRDDRDRENLSFTINLQLKKPVAQPQANPQT